MPGSALPNALSPELAARFSLVEEFSGGEGWTGKVRDLEGSGQPLRVLKVLDGEGDLEEASLLASLRHSQIPTVLEVGQLAGGRAYLLREFADGIALDQLRPMSPEQATELATQLFQVLAFVHLRGVLHLDIKPANLLLDRVQQQDIYRLLDFGLGSRASAAGKGGTLFFAAPEQLLGLLPEPRSDLFAVGALLFFMLQKAKPDLQRFIASFPRHDFFTAIGSSPEELPAPFDQLIPRLVARQPRDRYFDAQEALEALAPGSGRPSLSALIPDPIATYGQLIESEIAGLPDSIGIEIRGGDADDRRAMALHGACLFDDLERIESLEDACLIHRRGQTDRRVCMLPVMDSSAIAQHLSKSLALDSKAAAQAARSAHQLGATSPAGLRSLLENLVAQGEIIPQGTGWHWPAAYAGRLHLENSAQEVAASPEAIFKAAASGRVETATRAYQQGIKDTSVDERVLRLALVRGLLRAGEPRRAMPLTDDLPLQRARALLDLGDLRRAEAELAQLPGPDRGPEPERLRMQAWIAFLKGEHRQALEVIAELRRHEDQPEDRIIEGFILAADGEVGAAKEILRRALERLDAEQQPFLRAAALTNLGELERQAGALDAAQQCHLEALHTYRALGNLRHTATACSNLGVVSKDLGKFDLAFTNLRQARSLFAHVEDREGTVLAEANLGIVSLESGDASAASRRISEAITKLEELGSEHALPMLRVLLARALAEQGEAQEAQRILDSVDTGASIRLGEHATRVIEILAQQPVTVQAEATLPDKESAESGFSKSMFRTIVAINRKLASCDDARQALNLVLETAVTLAGAREGYVLVSDESGIKFELRTNNSMANHAFSRSLANKAISQQRTLSADDALADMELMSMPSVRDLKIKSALCVPFLSATGVSGAIYVEHAGRGQAFGDVDKEILEVLADQAAIAIDRLARVELIAVELEQSERNLAVARRRIAKRSGTRMLGQSPCVQELRRQIDKFAPTGLSILIEGETGSGKELVARAIHEQGTGPGSAFVSENCSAIPAELIESELFGHCKGAFTGADADRPGLFELASGGTLFLDEIGDMSKSMQVKILRALQEGKIRRVGGQETIPIDLRLISATHRKLSVMIQAGEFREDLYYRIAAGVISVPPLRERGKDILLIARHLLGLQNRQHRRDLKLDAAGEKRLLAYSWPGNVRELEHVIARAFILTEGDHLELEHLPSLDSESEVLQDWPVLSLADAEARTIEAALASTNGDKSKAARVLGISRTALYAKLKKMSDAIKTSS